MPRAAPTLGLRALAATPLGRMIAGSMRQMPQQDRAEASVERLLSAVPHLVADSVGLETLSLEALARAAQVSPQAAYRYFRDARDVVRLFARRIQTVEHQRLLTTLLEWSFADTDELAEVAVGFVTAVLPRVFAIPGRLRAALLRDYLEVCYALIWTIAELVCAGMTERDDPCAGLCPMALNGALVSIISIAASACARGDASLAEGPSQVMLRAIFAAALGQRTKETMFAANLSA